MDEVNAALNTGGGAAHDERSVDLAELCAHLHEYWNATSSKYGEMHRQHAQSVLMNALPSLLERVAELEADRERLSRQWTCFHCGFQTGDRNEAAAHFGEMGEEEPLCLTWKDLDEHGKASELQNALGQLAEANVEIERLRLALSQIAYLKVPVKKIAREALGK